MSNNIGSIPSSIAQPPAFKGKISKQKTLLDTTAMAMNDLYIKNLAKTDSKKAKITTLNESMLDFYTKFGLRDIIKKSLKK